MSEHDDMDEIERIAQDALHARADQVEPSPDAYARLADKVTGAARRPAPWWQSPRLLWLGAAGATAAVIAIALVATFAGDEGDDESAVATQTPTAAVEPTPGPVGSPTPEPAVGTVDVLWPLSSPDAMWPTDPEEAVMSFHERVLGRRDLPLLRLTGGPSNEVEIAVALDSAQSAPTTYLVSEVEPGRWGISAVSSAVVLETTSELRSSRLSDAIRLVGSDTLNAFAITVVGLDDSVLATGSVFSTADGPFLDRIFDGGYRGAALVVATSATDGDLLAVSMRRVMLEPPGPVAVDDDATPTPVGGGADRNQGRPDGAVWPVETLQPFGEWPNTPEDAAQQFVQQVGGWTLPVADLEWLEPIQMIADVTLQSIGEDGEPFGAATVVRVVGGFDEAGVPNWGAMSARSERIQVSRVFTDNGEFLVTGDGLAFEGTIDTRLVDANGNIAGEGFLTGGGVELAPIEGTVPITKNFPGPGFAILYDIGGLGIAPTALTIVPIVLEEIDQPDPGAGSCSAEGLEPPTPDPDLLEAVEATRQAIAAAAIACDWAVLGALIDPTQFGFSFGADTDAIGFWEELEGDDLGEPMRFLVETLKLSWVVDPTGESTDGDEPADWYIWPDAFPMLWEDVTPEMRDALRPLYDDQDFESFANIGGFAGYRLAIDEHGIWRYFIAGD